MTLSSLVSDIISLLKTNGSWNVSRSFPDSFASQDYPFIIADTESVKIYHELSLCDIKIKISAFSPSSDGFFQGFENIAFNTVSGLNFNITELNVSPPQFSKKYNLFETYLTFSVSGTYEGVETTNDN